MRLPLFIAIACVFLFGVSPDSLAQKDSKYRIAYNVLHNDNADDYEVYVIDMDGSGQRNLTNNSDVAWTYHAYKKKIFFISDRGACRRCYYLYSMDSNGNNVRKITDLRLEDSWMGSRKNGKELVVTGRKGKEVRHQLFIVNVDTGEYRQITNEPTARFRDPMFSPDGKKIVAVYKKDKTEKKASGEVFIMDPDGTNRKQLTKYPENDTTAGPHRYRAGPPRWNRKHNFISYQSNQDGKSSLYAVTPDGKRHWKISENSMNEGWHDWSPDGKWLAVEMWTKKKDSPYGIYLMNYETKEMRQLTNSKRFKYQQAPVFVEASRYAKTSIDPRQADLQELLRLHKQHQTAHLTYNAELFIETFAENLPQIRSGEIRTSTKAENLKRIKSYFSTYKFLEWKDIKRPVIKISKDGTLATKMVQKRVRGTYKNEKGEEVKDHTVFAWLEVWEKVKGKWIVTAVASTRKAGVD